MARFDRVIPVLVYEDIAAAHDFLVEAFGFEAGGVQRDGDGRAVHGEVRIGETTLWLHRTTAEHDLASAAGTDRGSGLVVHVDDVDAHYERARAAGVTIDAEPADQPYGQREYGARDPEGHRWWFATAEEASNYDRERLKALWRIDSFADLVETPADPGGDLKLPRFVMEAKVAHEARRVLGMTKWMAIATGAMALATFAMAIATCSAAL